MLNVYCIPGMGVDERLFRNLKLHGCTLQPVKWETPHKRETLPHYAMRLAKQIDTSKPFALLGVSFGGMCATEIAKQLHPVKTFVISSCKVSEELPLRLTIWKYVPLYKRLSDRLYKDGAMLFKKQFGVVTDDQAKKFKEMLDASPHDYFKGAVHCLLTWKNKIVPASVIHIHGNADKVLSIDKVKPNYIIEAGSHFMIINKAKEINEIINEELKGFV